jgi:Phage capsid family
MSSQLVTYSPTISGSSPRSSERQPHKRLRPSDVLVRAATAELLRQSVGQDLFENVALTIARHYASCPATTAYIERAAASPANSTTVGWAAELVGQSVIDFIANDMARQSGFAQLAARALTVPLEQGVGSIKIPSRASPLTLLGAWVGEGNAKPLFAAVFNSTTLASYKLSAVSVFTEEMMAASAIEQIVREVLAHDLTALLDTALFDATAASSVRPAGLFNGATTVTASATTPLNEAMIADLRGLAAAVAGSGNPDANVVFVVNPAQAIRIGILAPDYANLIVSGYMPGGSVGAIDVSSVAMIVGTPVFAVTNSAALNMDSAAGPLSTPGSPNVVSAPLRSLFQEDCVGLRCVLRAGWVKRRAAATALASSVTW